MREIVHIQAGQCGNQIGAKVSLFYNLFTIRIMFTNYFIINFSVMEPIE